MSRGHHQPMSADKPKGHPCPSCSPLNMEESEEMSPTMSVTIGSQACDRTRPAAGQGPVQDLSESYRPVPARRAVEAIKPFSFDLGVGQTAIVGEAGSGRSTSPVF